MEGKPGKKDEDALSWKETGNGAKGMKKSTMFDQQRRL